jgi:hypothetical protein
MEANIGDQHLGGIQQRFHHRPSRKMDVGRLPPTRLETL